MINKFIPTAHNECADSDEIASTVLMPGDPLRAKFIAENYLEDVKIFNNVRNVCGYTGTYKGKRISVMASGMGIPSIAIYSYELYKFYGVENIIRIGSSGAYTKDIRVLDVVLVTETFTNSNYAKTLLGEENYVEYPSEELNQRIKDSAAKLGYEIKEAVNYSTDVFYNIDQGFKKGVEEHNCKTVEMESFALFTNARVLGKKAACILTVSDSFVYPEETTAEERATKFTKMIEIALNA